MVIHEKASTVFVTVAWEPVQKFYIHGRLLGYKIYCSLITDALVEVVPAQTLVFTVGPKTTSTKITELRSFSVYTIQIAAFTRKGAGVRSNSTKARELIFKAGLI